MLRESEDCKLMGRIKTIDKSRKNEGSMTLIARKRMWVIEAKMKKWGEKDRNADYY